MGTRMRTMAANRMGSAWESGESGAPTRYMRDEPDGRLEPPMCGQECLADGAGVGVAAAATASPCDAGGFVSPGRRRLTGLGAVVAGESIGLTAVVEPAHL